VPELLRAIGAAGTAISFACAVEREDGIREVPKIAGCFQWISEPALQQCGLSWESLPPVCTFS